MGYCQFVHVHSRKEIENFLLVPSVLNRAVRSRLDERQRRTGRARPLEHDIAATLDALTELIRRDVQSQCLTYYIRYEKTARRGTDEATLAAEALRQFEEAWADLSSRLAIVPGKEVFARLNAFLMEEYDVSLSHGAVVRAFRVDEIPQEMTDLVRQIDEFSGTPIGDV
jgi:hypothetical protein